MLVSRTLTALFGAAALTSGAIQPGLAQIGPPAAGTLTCRTIDQGDITPSRTVRCVYVRAADGVREYFVGRVDGPASDQWSDHRDTLSWAVVAPSARFRPDGLVGSYTRADGAGGTAGADAYVLTSSRSVILRPVGRVEAVVPATRLTLTRVGTIEEPTPRPLPPRPLSPVPFD